MKTPGQIHSTEKFTYIRRSFFSFDFIRITNKEWFQVNRYHEENNRGIRDTSAHVLSLKVVPVLKIKFNRSLVPPLDKNPFVVSHDCFDSWRNVDGQHALPNRDRNACDVSKYSRYPSSANTISVSERKNEGEKGREKMRERKRKIEWMNKQRSTKSRPIDVVVSRSLFSVLF